jgi:hypothetical protein
MAFGFDPKKFKIDIPAIVNQQSAIRPITTQPVRTSQITQTSQRSQTSGRTAESGSNQIQCAQAKITYEKCPEFAQNNAALQQASRVQNIELYKQIFNKQLDVYQSLRNSNKTLQASVEPLQSYTKILSDQVNNSDSELSNIKNQITTFQNEIREYVPSKPVGGPFNTKNSDTGVQIGFYLFFSVFLVLSYLYVTIVIQQQLFSFLYFIGSIFVTGIIVYISYLAINKYLTNVSFDPEKITSSVQSFVKNIK